MPNLITTLGPKRADELGMILPHEHVFVDLRTCDQPGYAQAEAADVIALMAPELAAARAAGVTALVECTPVGVGRRADILKAVSEATGCPAGGADRHLPRAVGARLGARRQRGRAVRLDAGRAERRRSSRAACRPAASSSAPATTASPSVRRRSCAPQHAPRATPARRSAATPSAAASCATSSISSRRAATRPSASSGSTPAPSRTSR